MVTGVLTAWTRRQEQDGMWLASNIANETLPALQQIRQQWFVVVAPVLFTPNKMIWMGKRGVFTSNRFCSSLVRKRSSLPCCCCARKVASAVPKFGRKDRRRLTAGTVRKARESSTERTDDDSTVSRVSRPLFVPRVQCGFRSCGVCGKEFCSSSDYSTMGSTNAY